MTKPVQQRNDAHLRGPGPGIALGVVLLVIAVVVAILGRGAAADPAPVTLGNAHGAHVTTQQVTVTLADMRITPATIEVPVGTHVVLEVINQDAMTHDLVLDTGAATPLLAEGESATLDVGTMTTTTDGWCSLPGHRAAGMTMEIVVTGGADADSPTAAEPDPMAGHGSGAHGGATGEPRATYNPAAEPGPQWQPYDPNLAPAPGAHEHVVTLTVRDTEMEVAPGVTQTMWAFDGTVPGPTLRGKVGDIFTVTFVNGGTMDHGIDFHAGVVSPDEVMKSIAPGESVRYQFTANGSGAWLYHCSTMPMSLHIANGMFGAVIIDPPNLPSVDREFVLVQSELYLGPQGGIADEGALWDERPDAIVFNGYADQYVHAPIEVATGERIRMWVVVAGPQRATSFHVVGTQFDTVFKEGAYLLRPDNPEHGLSQALDLTPGQGGFVEFVLPEEGHYTFVDHFMVDGERGGSGVLYARDGGH